MRKLPLNLYIEDKLILQFRDEYYKYIAKQTIEDNIKLLADDPLPCIHRLPEDLDEEKLYEIIKNEYGGRIEEILKVPYDVGQLIASKLKFPSGQYKNKDGVDISICVREGDIFKCENKRQQWSPTSGKIEGDTLNNMFEHFEKGVVGTWNPENKSIEFSNGGVWIYINA